MKKRKWVTEPITEDLQLMASLLTLVQQPKKANMSSITIDAQGNKYAEIGNPIGDKDKNDMEIRTTESLGWMCENLQEGR
ncbi:hypothetical protein SUGI_0107630 [Cryptomeria japonica]|nr:hypothetical protein SUGI_0107630 [Cryptomeria japonica]